MRKITCNIITGTVLSFFALSALSAPVEPVRTLVIFHDWNWSDPVMDGVTDDVYGEAQTTTIFNPTGYEGDADFTASFRLCYDLQYLYVLAMITDDVDHSYQWNVGNPWEFDNVELFLQLDTNTVTTSYDSATIQLRICRGLDSVESAGRAPRSDYQYYMEAAAAGGWITEVAVPWTAVLPEGTEAEHILDYVDLYEPIGFDFSGADSDNSDGDADVGNRDVQSAWDEDDPSNEEDRTEDLAWNNTSVFGYVSLCCGGDIHSFASTLSYNLKCSPNPAKESVTLPDVEKTGSVSVYDITGALLLSKEYHPGEAIDISGWVPGIYTVVLDGTNSGRFVKE